MQFPKPNVRRSVHAISSVDYRRYARHGRKRIGSNSGGRSEVASLWSPRHFSYRQTARRSTHDLSIHRSLQLCRPENGALAYEPSSRETTLLAEPLPDRFIKAVQDAKIPIEIGTVIVATHVPHQAKVLEIIQQLGLELKIVFNRSAVMVQGAVP